VILLLNPVEILNFAIPVDLRYGFVNDYRYLYNVSGVLNIQDSTFGFVSSSSDTRFCWYRCATALQTIPSGVRAESIPVQTTPGQNVPMNMRLTLGQDDPHFILIESAQTENPPLPKPAQVNRITNSWAMLGRNPNSSAAATGLYRYRTTFNLTGYNISTVNLKFWGIASFDDTFEDVILNGVSKGFTQELFEHSMTSGFLQGENTIDFVVMNISSFFSFQAYLYGTVRLL
jgi:hypothetical protein